MAEEMIVRRPDLLGIGICIDTMRLGLLSGIGIVG